MFSRRVIVSLIVLFCIPTGPASAQTTTRTAEALTWDNLDDQFARAVDEGFAGAALLVRDGEIVFHKGFGMANREREIPNSTETVFAIGSTPIDFTKAGILLLADRGTISLSDRISSLFENVPEDKQSITIEHLMTGRSGLRDFHDLPSDENPDHTWIDRDEALRRIFAQKLLFEPGTKREHSHSAFGVLAAVIEIAAEQTYADFCRNNLFTPLGLKNIGFFGEDLAQQRVAVGYGLRKSSAPNSPPHWGKTSWLVMGSGGQVATLEDIYRWVQALRDGKLLSPESQQRYFGRGSNVYSNGDMFGFEFMFNDGPDSMAFLISNNVGSREQRQRFDKLARELISLTKGQPAANFSLGVALRIESQEGMWIQEVIAGSAAERDGLKADDQVVAIGGEALGEDPQNLLAPYLHEGRPIPFTIQRDGQEMKITVTPNPK